MKFTTAWAQTAAQNVTLKAIVTLLSITTIGLGITTAKLALRDPLIIERSCYNKILEKSSNAHSLTEIEIFVKEAVSQRFNSEGILSLSFLSSDEEYSRREELKELATRNMVQTVVVRSVKIDGNTAFVDADRLIAVGKIRTSLAMFLLVTFTSTDRSESNPYGLQISKIKPVNQDEKKQ